MNPLSRQDVAPEAPRKPLPLEEGTRRPSSLRTRLLATYVLPTAVLLMLTASLGYVIAKRALEEELGRSLTMLAAVGASQVAGERLITVAPGDDTAQTRTWRNMHRLLMEVRDASGTRRLFAVNREGQVLVDTGGQLPVGTLMPELARDTRELEQVFAGTPMASQVLFQGTDGRSYKTGYAPIRDSDGNVVGAMGIEGTASFFEPLRALARTLAAMSALLLGLMGFLAGIMAGTFTEPLARLMESATRIGKGDLSTEVPQEGALEVVTLARELELMRRALESRDRQLKMMLGGVAHEVRNPMGGIELFAGLLAEELPESQTEARAHVTRIRREIAYLQRIVEDFLVFAREQKLEKVSVDAASLAERAKERVEAEALGKDVTLAMSADEAPLWADENLLCAALMNLVKNAVQASPSGSSVGIEGRRLDQNRYRFSVRDAGSGIPPELLERIFEPFYTTREQGTGLGLSLAKKLAHAHGGELQVRSRPGETVFELELPLQTEA